MMEVLIFIALMLVVAMLFLIHRELCLFANSALLEMLDARCQGRYSDLNVQRITNLLKEWDAAGMPTNREETV